MFEQKIKSFDNKKLRSLFFSLNERDKKKFEASITKHKKELIEKWEEYKSVYKNATQFRLNTKWILKEREKMEELENVIKGKPLTSEVKTLKRKTQNIIKKLDYPISTSTTTAIRGWHDVTSGFNIEFSPYDKPYDKITLTFNEYVQSKSFPKTKIDKWFKEIEEEIKNKIPNAKIKKNKNKLEITLKPTKS